MTKKHMPTIIIFLLFLFSIIFFIYKNIIGLGYLPFSDESGHFLGAIAIHHGDILYRDYIDAHGPLIFIMTWLLGQLVGFSKLWLFRLVSTIFVAAAGIIIFKSALFQNIQQRFIAVALWFTSIACVWIVQGLYLNSYWTIGGVLAVISLASIIFPMLYEENIVRAQAFIGGGAIGLLPFAAYPFSLLSIAFIFVIVYLSICKYKFYSNTLLMAFLGSLSAVLIIVFWLLIYGDIGGMIAFHFIANQFYYSNYTVVSLKFLMIGLTPRIDPAWLIEDIAIYCLLGGTIFLCISVKNKIAAIVTILGIITLQLRAAPTFQNGSFLIASVGLFILSVIHITKNKPKLSIGIGLLSILVIAVYSHYATSSPSGITTDQRKNIKWNLLGERKELSSVQEIQKYVAPNQRILIIPYNPDIYIYANRLPIKKYHAYLPWEADYAKHPWYGYDRDICVDLPKERPAVIYLDLFDVWGHTLQEYMPCVLNLMKRDYTKMPNGSFVYVRNDLLNKK